MLQQNHLSYLWVLGCFTVLVYIISLNRINHSDRGHRKNSKEIKKQQHYKELYIYFMFS